MSTDDLSHSAPTSGQETPRNDTLQIGAVAEQTGLSLRTLRHYDEVGLLRPSARTAGGFRLYTQVDIERLMLIRRMKPLGFSLEEMGELLELTDEPRMDSPAVTARLEEFLTAARDRRQNIARTLDMADEFIDRLQAVASAKTHTHSQS